MVKKSLLGLVVLCWSFLGVGVFATVASPESHFQTDGNTLTRYIGTGGDVVIPSVINGRTITKIGELAFWQSPVDSVVVPGTVKTIDGWAFYDCNQMQRLTLEEGVTTLGEVSFYYCENLREVNLPQSLTKIYEEAFAYCLSLEEIVLPSSLITLEYGVFHACENLKSIVIPDSVTTLGDWAFYNCSSLVDVTLSTQIKKLDDGVFSRCTSLLELTIPEGVTTVNDMAFLGATQLKQVFFPSTITTMGEYLFGNSESIIYPEESTEHYPVLLWGYEGTEVETYTQQEGMDFLTLSSQRSVMGHESYGDVSQQDWYLRGVTFVSNYQLMSGWEGNFYPNDSATRGTTAEVFALLSGEDLEGNWVSFGDVSEEKVAYVAWCQEAGVMSGYSEEYFAQEQPLTREQFATILASYSGYKGVYQEVEPITLEVLGTFEDSGEISAYAQSPLAWAVEQGLFMGYDGKLNPQSPVTRGEVATVVLSYYLKSF